MLSSLFNGVTAGRGSRGGRTRLPYEPLVEHFQAAENIYRIDSQIAAGRNISAGSLDPGH